MNMKTVKKDTPRTKQWGKHNGKTLSKRKSGSKKRKFKIYPSAYANMCTHQPYVQVKLHQVARRKEKKKAMGSGMMRDELRVGGLARRKRRVCA